LQAYFLVFFQYRKCTMYFTTHLYVLTSIIAFTVFTHSDMKTSDIKCPLWRKGGGTTTLKVSSNKLK